MREKGKLSMEMNKDEFLKSELGLNLLDCLTTFNGAINLSEIITLNQANFAEIERVNRVVCEYAARLEIYRLAIKQFYGITYHFLRTDLEYGLVTSDMGDWLIKYERQSAQPS